MPLVTVRYDPHVVDPRLIPGLGNVLCCAVSSALTVPGNPDAHLAPEDVEIKFEEIGRLDKHCLPLGIHIVANDYPERSANRDLRREKIQNAVSEFLMETMLPVPDKGSRFIWLCLVKGSFSFF